MLMRPGDTRTRPSSALIERLRSYTPLTGDELDVVAELESERLSLRPRQHLVKETQQSESIFILQEGALYTSTILTGGARQILRVHYPGDLVNVTAIGWSRVAATITAVTPAKVSRFPRMRLSSLFAEQPRLAALLYGIAVVESVSFTDRLKSLGRTDGRTRICTLLLELHSRQRLTIDAPQDSLVLFLTQSEIADSIGVTKVHVNRLFKELAQEGLIARQGRQIQLCDIGRLVEACGFVDRYKDIATDWLPHSPTRH